MAMALPAELKRLFWIVRFVAVAPAPMVRVFEAIGLGAAVGPFDAAVAMMP